MTKKNKYGVLLSTKVSRYFKIEAASEKQARRVVDKIIYFGGINEDGIEGSSSIWKDADEPYVNIGGLAMSDKEVARSMTDEGHSGEYDEFEYELEEAR